MQGLTEDILKQAIEVASPSEKLILLEHLEELERRKNRDAAQLHFMPFVRHIWPDFINGAHHQRMAKLFEDVANGKKKRVIINMAPRHAVITSTKIPTTTGFKLLADLQVGDYVFGPDGLPTQVIGKSDVFKDRALYRVTTDDGFSLDVDGEHLWTVRLTRKRNVYHDYTTEQLWQRQNGAHLRTKRGGGVEILANKFVSNPRLPRLPDCAPVEYAEKELLIDPYVLGLWLGDGSKNSAIITSHDNDQALIRPEIERRGYETTNQATKCSFGILKLKTQLNELNLIGNKHIPDIYLEGSVAQRRDLLKGLMDSDGNISKKGQCFFSQKSLAFIAQVRVLLASLGIKNSIQISEAKIGGKSYGDTYHISFYANNIAFLPRKESRTLKNERTFGRYIKIEKLETVGDTQCIKVAREDGLFLAGEGYICTHNTKSEFASYLLPAWFLGKFPKKKIMQISNTAELAEGFGRKVRNLVDSDEYKEIFPDVGLRADSKAAGRWNTNQGGEYYAGGTGAALAGRGADIAIIDDPHTESEALAAQFNPAIYNKTYEWYTSGPRQRLQPGGSIIIVMCMTGDTNVLMADGTTVQLKNIRVGDEVATFDKGKLTTSKINNWRSSGVDSVYKIQTQSGIILRANERHPFLVLNEGVLEWTRLRSLKPGMLLVATKDVQDLQGHKLNRECAAHAKLESVTIGKILKPLITQLGIMVSGKVKLVHAENRQKPKGYVTLATQKNTHQLSQHQRKIEQDVLNTDTESLWKPTLKWLKHGAIDVMFAGNYLPQKIQGLIGTRNYVSTIATTQEKLEGYSATTATSQLVTERQQMFSNELQRISDFTTDPIVSIVYAGKEEVFDVEVDRTENFIANGVVSHNTRWHMRDLTGQIIDSSSERIGADQWDVIEFPAILPSGKPLWPEFWSLQELEAVRAELPNSKWQAQYQQQPTSEQSAIIKREWWQMWEADRPPPVDYIIMAMDTAFEAKNSADYSAAVVFGVWYNPEDNDQPNLILLDMWRDKLEFPDLKAKTLELYKEWEPDALIIEKKASGAPLIAEIRKMGVPVQDYTPVRGTANNPNSKPIRLHAVSDVFASGKVWAPANTRWAEVLIDEVAAFPAGKNDDLVDCVSMAVNRYRQGGFIGTNLDEPEEQQYFKRKVAYY